MELGVITGEQVDEALAWAAETFGPGPRTLGVIDHIQKELVEIMESDERDWSEFIDVIILGIDGAGRLGASGEQILEAVKAKWAKNKTRVWPDWRQFSENEAVEHDRSYD